MLRYLRLFSAIVRYNIMRELMFKGNFILWIFVDIGWFGIQLALIQVIFSHTEAVAGWSKYQMIMLMGTSQLVHQIFQFIFLVSCMELPENVRTGKLDFFLLQPANSQFLISVRKVDLGAIINASIGLSFVVYAATKLGIHPSPSKILLFAMLVLNGVFINYSLMLVIVTLSFWIIRAQGLVYGYYNLFQITRIPREAFTQGIRFFFTFILPMLVVANFPAKLLAVDLASWKIAAALALTVGFFLTASLWFRFGLRHYTSASS
jgi:ABC-2 type transport system permease protein